MKLVFTCLAAAALAAPAAAATFDDRADFLAQGGTYTEHTDLFDDFVVTTPPGSSVNLSFPSFTDKFGSDPYIALNGVENVDLRVDFATSVFAFGMDVYEPIASTATFNGCNVGTCVESTFAISVWSGGVLLDSFDFSPDNEVLDFIGYASATPFDMLEIRETTGTNDNEFFGNFVTSSTALAAVPLPAGLPLLAAGLGALALLRRRQVASIT